MPDETRLHDAEPPLRRAESRPGGDAATIHGGTLRYRAFQADFSREFGMFSRLTGV